MIYGFERTQFSSMIYESDVVFGRSRSQRQPWNWVPVMIFGSGGTQILLMISDSHSLWGPKIQRQPWNWGSVMISRSGGTQFSSMIYESDVVFGR